MAKKPAAKKSVEVVKNEEAKRKNVRTAEFQSVLEKEQQEPKKVRYHRNTDLDPQLVWRGKDEQDWSDLVVHAPPLYIQEKVHPKVLIDDLLRNTKEREHEGGELTPDLFADFNGIPKGVDKTDFYQHDQNWSNRMILGDSLQVMASLAEREGLRGKVQCIYFDPPYGIKFNSNFQWSTTSRDVKDGNVGHITREITPTSLTINQLFGSTNEQYVVPTYQRRYSWNEKQIWELIDDISLLENGDTHLLGSIVCLAGHHKAGLNELELVDGQQRLTTVIILLECIR